MLFLPGFFVTKIFHPNVSKTGEICVSTLKKDWKKEMGIKHILLVRNTAEKNKCSFIVRRPSNAS